MLSADEIPHGGSYRRHFSHYSGLFFDEFCTDSAWIRETAMVQLPPVAEPLDLIIRGECRPHPAARGIELGCPEIECRVNDRRAVVFCPHHPGPFTLRCEIPASNEAQGASLTFHLHKVGFTNALAWLGRVTGLPFWQRFRKQNKNRQLRIATIETSAGEVIFDFANRNAPYSSGFARNHTKVGLNIVGFLTAELGVGESARCMVRAADAAGLPNALVPLKLHCKNRLGDTTYVDRMQDENPHAFNVVHLDPPASRDIDHHHGPTFRAGKYNIAYWAWELPEFPDAWVPSSAYFDEIWCPSDFVRDAIAMKVSLPVLTMPHSIRFERPQGDFRARFGLPTDRFLFLVLYDLNSYTARKNPQAAIEAYRRSGLGDRQAGLVIKVHNVKGNEVDFAHLREILNDVPGAIILSETLGRTEIYQLQAACDCFVSLHRSEGFGLAVAESMYLSKPVICTDWSATSEFVNRENGCPVPYTLQRLDRNYGPYGKGQVWAEPNVDEAAHWMQRLSADATLAQRLGRAGRETIAQRFAPEVIGARYRQRLENCTMWL